MSDLLLSVTTHIDALAVANVHTVAFIRELGDGTLRVRFCGPRATGVCSTSWNAPLTEVLAILADASGDLDGQQVAVFIPASGAPATSVQDCHASRAYAVLVHPAA